jgi:hypothetical protein
MLFWIFKNVITDQETNILLYLNFFFMTTGIIQRQYLLASQAVAASTVLVDVVGFTVPVVAGGRYHFRINAGFTTGATGGFKFRLEIPAAPTDYLNIQEVSEGSSGTPLIFLVSVITAEADFANAFANAANSFLKMEGSMLAAAAGDMKLQFACNSAANSISILKGSWMEVITL